METHNLLKNLIGVTLDTIEPDSLSVKRLLEASQTSLIDAQVKGLSNEGRFDLAYKSITQSSSAALQAHGYRVLTSKPGHHQTIIQSLVHTIGIDSSTLITLDQLRKQRNVIDYSGDIVSDVMLDEAIKQAEALLIKCSRAYRVIFNPDPWVDPDDAPEVTEEELKRGVWKIGGKIVTEAEGRAAFAKKLKEVSEKQGGDKNE